MTQASDLQGNDPLRMDFRFLFLEPQGRLAPRPFGRGLVLLTGASLSLTVLTAIAVPSFGPLQLALVFPYICLFAKRLHDGGLTGWFWLAFLFGYGLINLVTTAMLFPVLSPQAMAMQPEVQSIMVEVLKGGISPAETEAYNARMQVFTRLSAVTSAACLLIASAVTGFAAFRLRSDPKPNRHGPPTLGGPAGTFN